MIMKNGNEPVYPTGNEHCLTKREYFAAMATDNDVGEIMFDTENCEVTPMGRISKITRQQARFIHADAMITASEETNGN